MNSIVISYPQEYFEPFNGSKLHKDRDPEYVWAVDEDANTHVFPTYGRSFEKVKFLFQKEGLKVVTHAALNTVGQELMRTKSSLYNADDFFDFEAFQSRPHGEYNKVSSFSWYIDWSQGRENFKIVIDLDFKCFSYMNSHENYMVKRCPLFPAIKKEEGLEMSKTGYVDNIKTPVEKPVDNVVETVDKPEIKKPVFNFGGILKTKLEETESIGERIMELKEEVETIQQEVEKYLDEQSIEEKKPDNGFTFTFKI